MFSYKNRNSNFDSREGGQIPKDRNSYNPRKRKNPPGYPRHSHRQH